MSFALVKYMPRTSIGFIRLRFASLVFSSLLMIASLGAFFTWGINFGIDFTGGVQTEITTEGPADLEQIRSIANGLGLGEAQVQTAGNENRVLVTLPLQEGEGLEGEQAQQTARQALVQAMTDSVPGVTIEGSTTIGGAVSGEMVQKGGLAIGLALFLMLIYIFVAFQWQWQYSLGAIAALVHDVIATIGIFSVTQMTFDLATVAAILTIVGYSMNDTVVVYDRIRENLRKFKKEELANVLNRSINDTLSRTILTSVTTLLALIALYIIGGGSLRGFSFAMIWGVLIGTYSSIFVAAPILLFTDVRRKAFEDEEDND